MAMLGGGVAAMSAAVWPRVVGVDGGVRSRRGAGPDLLVASVNALVATAAAIIALVLDDGSSSREAWI